MMSGKSGPLRNVQEVDIWPNNQMVNVHKPESFIENETKNFIWDFEIKKITLSKSEY